MTNERDKTESQLHFVLLKHCKAFPFFIYDTWMHPGNFPSMSVVIIEGIDVFFFNPISPQHPQQAHYFWPELLTQDWLWWKDKASQGQIAQRKASRPVPRERP